jgi:hypothetical protein
VLYVKPLERRQAGPVPPAAGQLGELLLRRFLKEKAVHKRVVVDSVWGAVLTWWG